jgi:IclR family transcriptional regulator, acetate operon repressor
MKNKPAYALESVDNALRLLQTLRDQGSVRVSQVAEDLHIARSTAHRLLSMLVYRDFAVRGEDHTYRPGLAMSAPQLRGQPLQQLRRLLRPYMEGLGERVSETVNLMVRVGSQTRFLASVESVQLLHVGDRQGTILPAWRSSGGKALLAELPDSQVVDILRSDTGAHAEISKKERAGLFTELRSVRRQGYAVNNEGTEAGVCAVGMCVRDPDGVAVAALSISVPSVRYTDESLDLFVRELRDVVGKVMEDPGWYWLGEST